MDKVYVATGNPSKFANMEEIISWLDIDIAVEMIPKKLAVEENGESIAENSRLKVLPYKGKYEIPIVANDFGLEFEEDIIELQDSSKVKRAALDGKDLKQMTQEEVGRNIFEFYQNILKKYDKDILCKAIDVFTILLPDGKTKQTTSIRRYKMIYREVDDFDIYHPLNSLRVSVPLDKVMDEFTDEDYKADFEPLQEALCDLLNFK